MCVNIAAHFAGRLRNDWRTQPDRGSEALREERQIGQHEDVPRIIAMKPIDFFSHPQRCFKPMTINVNRCDTGGGTKRPNGWAPDRNLRGMLHICNRFATGL